MKKKKGKEIKETVGLVDLRTHLEENDEKISKAKKVNSLLQKQKGFLKDNRKLTDFKEPVADLYRRSGKIETYENVTAGKFVFTHSDGNERFIEIRPEDQCTRDYGDKKIRWYPLHEDRPFAGWENPVVDGESVKLSQEKSKATDLKYQERMQKLKNENKGLIVKIVIGIAIAVAVVMFAYATWFAPAQQRAAEAAARVVPPSAGFLMMKLKSRKL